MERLSSGLGASVLAVVVGLTLSACATAGGRGASAATGGALLGTAAGAGLGAIIGHQSGETGKGAALGAGIGALSGYIIGNEQDKTRTNDELQVAHAQASAAAYAANTVAVNVTNSNGSVTPVTLQRHGNLYVGPRGEQYVSMPTESQLRSVYGF